MSIPFHKPMYDGDDEQALIAAFRSGSIVGDATYTRQATAELARLLGVPHVLLTTSCTHALELAIMVLKLAPSDEVILPSFTFVSTANSILRAGARVVFADIDPKTLTIDCADVERKITGRTRAVFPVVYAGVSPDLERLAALCRPRGIVIIEDAAQGIGATYKGRAAGTTGDMGCYSFHETKNISTGEGGAFSTGSEVYATLAEIIREKGTNRKQFLQGTVDKYTWVDIGSSFLPPDHMGALLLSQLKKNTAIVPRRRKIHERYMEGLQPLADRGLLQLPCIPQETSSNYHLYYALLADESTRNRAIGFFRSKGIGTPFHYLPLHLSPVGRSLGFQEGDCPVTETVSERLLRLPLYPLLTDQEQGMVIDTMKEFLRV